MSPKKVYILILFAALLPYYVYPQKEKATERIDSLLNIGFENLDKQNNGALSIGFDCLEESQKLNYITGEAEAYSLIGKAYRRTGKYDKAIENQIKAYKLFEQTDNYFKVSSVCNNIAIIYILIHDYKKAIDYEQYAINALIRAKPVNHTDSFHFVNIYNQLGAANFELQNFNEAYQNFLNALKTAQQLDDYDGQAISLDNIAKIYLQKAQYPQALNYAQKSYKLRGEKGPPIDIVYSLSLFGWIYGEKGEYDKAIQFSKQAYTMADSANYIELKVSESKFLSEAYSKQRDYKNAYDYLQLYMKINDSLLSAETNKKIIEMEAEYHFEQQRSENEFLKEQNRLKEENLIQTLNQRRGLIVGFSVLVILLGVIVFFLVKGKRRNRQLVNLIQEKNTIMGILSHDMRTPLVKINSVANAHTGNDGAGEMLAIKAITSDGLEMLSNLLDVNYLEDKTPAPIISEIDVLEVMQQCMEENLEHSNAKQIAVKLDVQLDTIIAYSDKIMLKRVIDNLLSNAIKYSFPGSEVRIKISSYNNRQILFAFTDKGQGIRQDEKDKLFIKYAKLSAKPTAGELSTGLGLFIASWLVQLLQGKIWCESEINTGSTFYFTIPVNFQ